MTEATVEVVARAICREQTPYTGPGQQLLDDSVEEFWPDYRDAARAAIAAMSTPGEWRPQIGDHVAVIHEMLPDAYAADWADVAGRVSGMSFNPAFDGEIVIEISEVWPPKNGDRTDGFTVRQLRLLPAPVLP